MRIPTLVILAALAAACAGGTAPATGDTATAPAPATASATRSRPNRGSLSLITNAEIEDASADLQTALALVESLRPSMMRMRNPTAGTTSDGQVAGVIAYVDEVRLGSLENLRTVSRSTVREIRYISATDATNRWGTGHSSGVIQVITKR